MKRIRLQAILSTTSGYEVDNAMLFHSLCIFPFKYVAPIGVHALGIFLPTVGIVECTSL